MESHTHTIARLIKQADHFFSHHDWDEAATRCYQILALDPDHPAAQNKLRLIYLQRDLVHDMRCALLRLFDPTDASPHQLRRKLAFSYRVLSRWAGWLDDDVNETPPVYGLEEAAQIINHAYLLGEDQELLRAWNVYTTTCTEHPGCKYAIQLWMAKQYAEHGFFADATEILTEVIAHSPTNAEARYLLAEMRWWRDHADTIAWVL